MKNDAIVYCEKQFGLEDGKTANGLVRHSEIYNITGIIDSSLNGKDAGEVLGIGKKGIPIFESLEDAFEGLGEVPEYYVYGKAPLKAQISVEERLLILQAIKSGMNIVNGLHQLFSEDPEFAIAASKQNVKLLDIRKPPILEKSHIFSGDILKVSAPVVAVLGTDCACGKMTTAVELNKLFNQMGIKSILVGTGQTSLMQGSKYGIPMDAIASQFVIGELENSVYDAFVKENPDIILIEGQGAVSHEAFLSSIAILRGSRPNAVILQHPPARKVRCDFPDLAMPNISTEISLIGAISDTEVIAITLNHEGLTREEIKDISEGYESKYELPTLDVLEDGCAKLIGAVGKKFPKLNQKIIKNNLERGSLSTI